MKCLSVQPGQTVAVDDRVLGLSTARLMNEALAARQVALRTDLDLLDEIWGERQMPIRFSLCRGNDSGSGLGARVATLVRQRASARARRRTWLRPCPALLELRCRPPVACLLRLAERGHLGLGGVAVRSPHRLERAHAASLHGYGSNDVYPPALTVPASRPGSRSLHATSLLPPRAQKLVRPLLRRRCHQPMLPPLRKSSSRSSLAVSATRRLAGRARGKASTSRLRMAGGPIGAA